MNNEKYNQIIDKAYKNYKVENQKLADVIGHGFHGGRLTQEEFTNKIKTDDEFSKTWGLKIEERELSHDERFEIYKKVSGRDLQPHISGINFKKFHFDESNIPTKLITLTYNNETVEVYE